MSCVPPVDEAAVGFVDESTEPAFQAVKYDNDDKEQDFYWTYLQ
jgi:hypothetical protein